MLLDELLARFHLIAHKLAYRALGFGGVVDIDLQKRARCGLHRGFPQLLGIHLSQTLVALDVKLFRTTHLSKRFRKRVLVVDVALNLRRTRIFLLHAENRRAGNVDVTAID